MTTRKNPRQDSKTYPFEQSSLAWQAVEEKQKHTGHDESIREVNHYACQGIDRSSRNGLVDRV